MFVFCLKLIAATFSVSLLLSVESNVTLLVVVDLASTSTTNCLFTSKLSFIFLINVSISIVAFFCLFYLVENHENYLIIYFILSIFLLLSMILINHYKNKNEK